MDKLTSFFGMFTGGSATIDILLNPNDRNKFLKVKLDGKKHKLPVYSAADDISGVVVVEISGTKKYEHMGVRIELIGHLEIFQEQHLSTDFMMMSKELEPAGALYESRSLPFNFPRFEKQYETFTGIAGQVQYYLRATIQKNITIKTQKITHFAVQNPTPELAKLPAQPIKVEVGIENMLHIEFQYANTRFHLKDCITGRIFFHLVKIRIQSMQLAIVRKETFGTGQKVSSQLQTLQKFEIMDGCPAQDESIPLRIYLSAIDLTPSYKNVNNRLQVRHFVNLVILDEDGRKYYRQHDIEIYRRK